MIFLRIFFEFFKTGLFAVGGGMATIPFLYKISDSTGWFTHQDLANMIAVSESTPGPIGVNMATYVGYITGMRESGVFGAILGAVTATLGLIAPAVIIILIVASFLKNFRDNKYLNSAFYGLRPASTGLIAAAGLSVAASNFFPEAFTLASFNWKGAILAVVLIVLTNIKKLSKIHPIVFIALSAVVGVVFSF
ncbi:MAG: chromate transporter [Clostridia bacterium]|nr:chromate transporter [Clostridia bacterium]